MWQRIHHRAPLVAALGVLLAYPLTATEPPPEASGLDVLFLLDRSPSASSKSYEGKAAVDWISASLREQVILLAEIFDIDIRIGAANFGGQLGHTYPLAPIEGHTAQTLPPLERLSFTDFRPPLEFALNQFPETSATDIRLVFLVTDAQAELKNNLEWNESQKRKYMLGDAGGTKGSVRHSLAKLQERRVQIVLLAVGDNGDASLWNQVLPAGNYVAWDSFGTTFNAARRILLESTQTLRYAPVLSEDEIGPPPPLPSSNNTPPPLADPADPEVPAPFHAGTFVVLITVIILLLAMLRHLQHTTPAGQMAPPTEQVEVESLRQKALTFAGKHQTSEATAFFEKALDKAVALAREAQELSSRQISTLYRDILGSIHPGDTAGQREYLLEQLARDASPERARGVGPILLERWSTDKSLIASELFQFLNQPRTGELLQGFLEAEMPHGQELTDASLLKHVKKLARANQRLHSTLGVTR